MDRRRWGRPVDRTASGAGRSPTPRLRVRRRDVRRACWTWGPQVDKTSPAHAIDIHDPYFSYREVRDRFSGKPGYHLTAEILLHECFHVLDDGAGSVAIARLAGFFRSGTGWHFSILTAEDAVVFNSMSAADERMRAGDRSI